MPRCRAWLGHSVGVVFDIVANVLAEGGLNAVLERRRRRKRRKAPLGDDVECSLRLLDGTCGDLSSKWRTGHAVLKPHSMIFNGMHLQDVEVEEGRRSVDGGEVFVVNRDCVIVTVRTQQARLEWAVLGEQLERALGRLQEAEG